MKNEKEVDLERWRPFNWDNPFCENLVDEASGIVFINDHFRDFEDGADAMYQAIREKLGKMAFLLDGED